MSHSREKEYRSAYLSLTRARYKKKGMCSRCGETRESAYAWCWACRQKQRQYFEGLRERRRANQECVRCGSKLTAAEFARTDRRSGNPQCRPCRIKRSLKRQIKALKAKVEKGAA